MLKYRINNKYGKGDSIEISCLEMIDSYLLATADSEFKTKIWNLNEKKCIFEPTRHSEFVSGLTLVNENKLASCSLDEYL